MAAKRARNPNYMTEEKPKEKVEGVLDVKTAVAIQNCEAGHPWAYGRAE